MEFLLKSLNREGGTMDKDEYKNRKIEFKESENPEIVIDEEPIQVNWDADANEFNAGELPYRSFKSIKELAEAIVDQRHADG